MPEATVDEYDGAPPCQHNVGMARKVLCMQSKPESLLMQKTSDSNLWLRVLATDSRHMLLARQGLCFTFRHFQTLYLTEHT